MTITRKQLTHAAALKKLGNFGRAAASENLSQPAFSRSIQNLEEALGVQLFNRGPGPVTVTAYGRAVLRRANKILKETEELEQEVRLMRGLESGQLKLALAVFPANLSGFRGIATMLRRHPNIGFRAEVGDWRFVAKSVLELDSDLGMADVSEYEDDKFIGTEIVGQHEVVLYCRAGHPLSSKRRVSKADLDQYPLAMVRLPKRLAPYAPGLNSRVDPITGYLISAIEVDNLPLIQEIVSQSDVISAAAPVQIESQLRSGAIGILPYRQAWMRMNYGFVYLKDRLLSPVVQEYMDTIREIEIELAARNIALIEEFLD